MYLSKFRLHSYKSFLDSGEINFKPGINIIVGANNAGKTSLLESLTLYCDDPHRSIKTHPKKTSKNSAATKIEFSIEIDKSELISSLEKSNFKLLAPKEENVDPYLLLQNWLKEPGSVSILARAGSGNPHPKDLTLGLYEGVTISPNHRYLFYNYNYPLDWSNKPIESMAKRTEEGIENSIPYKIISKFKSRIYRFQAERLNVSKCKFGHSSKLSPNASNLAEVLGVLQGSNPHRYNKFNELVSEIFQHVKRVAVVHREENELEIMVWNIDTTTERDDLAIPLSQSGTGIGQVLAILYIILTAEEPQTIIIDEPQSFLHPGAARKLIEILGLELYRKHQYFIATHSPTVISAADPSTITVLQYSNCETITKSIETAKSAEIVLMFEELGVKLRDLFGADKILWVEGPTEAASFPLILSKFNLKESLLGIEILPLTHTGDLEGKHLELVLKIYEQLSGGNAIFPPAIAILVDLEEKSAEKVDELKKRCSNVLGKNILHFLPYRLYENYLLLPEAVAATINKYDMFREEEGEPILTPDDINKKILEIGKSESLFSKEDKTNLPEVYQETWVKKVHGAELLYMLFRDLTNKRVRFDKIPHSIDLTKYILENNSEHLAELSSFLKQVIDKDKV